jgi:hypothetical protein
MKRIEMDVFLRLHEMVTIPTLLSNSETWMLNKSERKGIDKIEIWAMKKMIGLPITTPTAAVIFMTGAMFATIRMDVKQLQNPSKRK